MGRPYKYTPEQLEAKIDEYFKKKEKEGREKKLVFCSIRDLASFLDIDLQTWYNYDSRPDYSSITKKAKDRIYEVFSSSSRPGRSSMLSAVTSIASFSLCNASNAAVIVCSCSVVRSSSLAAC